MLSCQDAWSENFAVLEFLLRRAEKSSIWNCRLDSTSQRQTSSILPARSGSCCRLLGLRSERFCRIWGSALNRSFCGEGDKTSYRRCNNQTVRQLKAAPSDLAVPDLSIRVSRSILSKCCFVSLRWNRRNMWNSVFIDTATVGITKRIVELLTIGRKVPSEHVEHEESYVEGFSVECLTTCFTGLVTTLSLTISNVLFRERPRESKSMFASRNRIREDGTRPATQRVNSFRAVHVVKTRSNWRSQSWHV